MTKSNVKNTTINQQKSDAKRGVKTKAFKLPLQTIAEFEQLAQQRGKSNNAMFIALLDFYQQHHQ